MRNILTGLGLLLLGFYAGAKVTWLQSYTYQPVPSPPVTLETLFAYADTPIAPEDLCSEGDTAHNVGAVMASIFWRNESYTRNRVSYYCMDEECFLSHSGCAPWQSSECGARVLRFGMLPDGGVDASSFSCIDIP
jgi:hypothetical protein